MLKPYELKEAQLLLEQSIADSTSRHDHWRALELLWRTGEAHDGPLGLNNVPGQVFQEMPSLTLDVINYVLPAMTLIIESVTDRDPEHVVIPMAGGEEAEVAAKVSEVTLRYFWARMRALKVLADATRDFVLVGNGFVKVGWAYSDHEEDRGREEVEAEVAALLESDRLHAALSGDDLMDDDGVAELVSLVARVVDMDEPYCEYVSPYDMFFPSDARRIETCRWTCQRIVLPRDEVEDNDLYDEDALAHLVNYYKSADGSQAHMGGGLSTSDTDRDPFAMVELFEFHDRRTDTMIVFQLGVEHALWSGDVPFSHRRPAVVHMPNFQPNNTIWAFGDVDNVASIQAQVNTYVRTQSENASRAGNKYFIDSQYVTPEVRAALTSDESEVVIPIDRGQTPMSDIVQMMPRAGLSNDVYAAKGDAVEAFASVLGLNDFQQGGSGADRMSATAAAVVDGTATLRSSGKRAAVEQAAADVGTIVLLLCQEFLDDERAVRIAGPEGAAWVNVSRKDLVGEWDVQVTSGSMQALNPATRRQNAMELLSAVVPLLQSLGYDVDALVRRAMRDLGYKPDQVLRRPEPTGPPVGPEGAPMGDPGPAPLQLPGGPPVPAATQGDIAL